MQPRLQQRIDNSHPRVGSRATLKHRTPQREQPQQPSSRLRVTETGLCAAHAWGCSSLRSSRCCPRCSTHKGTLEPPKLRRVAEWCASAMSLHKPKLVDGSGSECLAHHARLLQPMQRLQ